MNGYFYIALAWNIVVIKIPKILEVIQYKFFIYFFEFAIILY